MHVIDSLPLYLLQERVLCVLPPHLHGLNLQIGEGVVVLERGSPVHDEPPFPKKSQKNITSSTPNQLYLGHPLFVPL